MKSNNKESNTKVFCIKPWVHLHINTRGMAQACCISNINYGNVNDSSINEIWCGDTISKIREQFKNNIPDKRCNNCIKRELAGHPSLRTEVNNRYGNSIPNDFEHPVYWDVRFSNVCNFRCRTCWHGNSSKWFEESKILKTNIGDKAIINAFDDEKSFLTAWEKNITYYEEMYFAGGEPLVNDMHYAMLELLIKNQRFDIKIHYNTNLSILDFKNYDLIQLWSKFENIKLSVSIDHIKEKGEYVRKDLDWEKFTSNLDQVLKLDHIRIIINPTISIFNILDLPEIHDHFKNEFQIPFSDIELNILDRPFFYNVQSLDKNKKQLATVKLQEHIKKLKELNTPTEQFESLITYLSQDQKSAKGFEKHNSKLDELRSEKFKKLFYKRKG